MQPKHSSPDDFIMYLRFAHENPMSEVQSAPNLEFQKIYNEKWSTIHKGKEAEKLGATSAHQHIASNLWNSLRACLPESAINYLDAHLSVGALDSISVNAICAKSAEGYFAILLNAGLMTLLNKLSKILSAINDPGSVLYCNRIGSEQITTETLKKWYLEVCEHYRETSKPLGPQIHLRGDAELRHCMQLNLWEMFVLCHEVGHILCGHLDKKEFLVKSVFLGMADTLEENKNHEMEVEADIVGFILLREYANKELFHQREDWTDDRPFLAAMITLFNLFYLLGATESRSHPHPLDRLCNIAAAVYGERFADMLARSYDNHDLLAELFKNPIHASDTLVKEVLHD